MHATSATGEYSQPVCMYNSLTHFPVLWALCTRQHLCLLLILFEFFLLLERLICLHLIHQAQEMAICMQLVRMLRLRTWTQSCLTVSLKSDCEPTRKKYILMHL